MATKKSTQFSSLAWRNVPAECMGEGALSGHRLARDLMRLSRESPSEGKIKAGDLIKHATLAHCAFDMDEYAAGKAWAATAFLGDMASFIVYAAKDVDYEDYFKRQASLATDLINRTSHHPRPPDELNSTVGRRARKPAKEAIAKIMRNSK